MREDAGHDIEGNDPLGRLLLAIDGEGDAELAEGGLGGLLAAIELGIGSLADPPGELAEPRTPGAIMFVAPDFVERMRHRVPWAA